jgi:hypothetical protein
MTPEPNGTSGWIENSARVWKVDVKSAAEKHERVVPESELTGEWEQLAIKA